MSLGKKNRPCTGCGTDLPPDEQVGGGNAVRCISCVHTEKLQNATDTDQCCLCQDPIGTHREMRANGTLVCVDCGTGASAQVRRTTPATGGSAAAEEEVAAEIEKLMGSKPNTAPHEAYASPAVSQHHVTEAELIAAMDDLEGQRSTATRAAVAKKSAAPASDEADRLIAAMQLPATRKPTEEEVAAELEKLMGPPREKLTGSTAA